MATLFALRLAHGVGYQTWMKCPLRLLTLMRKLCLSRKLLRMMMTVVMMMMEKMMVLMMGSGDGGDDGDGDGGDDICFSFTKTTRWKAATQSTSGNES